MAHPQPARHAACAAGTPAPPRHGRTRGGIVAAAGQLQAEAVHPQIQLARVVAGPVGRRRSARGRARGRVRRRRAPAAAAPAAHGPVARCGMRWGGGQQRSREDPEEGRARLQLLISFNNNDTSKPNTRI